MLRTRPFPTKGYQIKKIDITFISTYFLWFQSGQTVSRIIKELDEPQYTFKDIFQVERPQIDLTFENIIAYTNTVFVIRAKDRIRLSPRRSVGNAQAAFTPTSPCKLNVPAFLGEDGDSTHRKRMCLKGQMCYIPETDKILFLCSPSVGCLEDLNERGLYLSDIPIHDSTRDLVLLSEQFRAEYELTQKLEVMNDKLQQTYRELEIEKQLTDKLVYSILPPSVRITIITARKRSLGNVIFLHLSVILFSEGRVPGQVNPPGRYTPQAGTPSFLAGPPPGQVHPPGRYTPSLTGTPPRAGTSPAGTLPWEGLPPWAGTPTGRYIPPGRYAGEQCMLGNMGNKRVVRNLLECILVGFTIPEVCVKSVSQ